MMKKILKSSVVLGLFSAIILLASSCDSQNREGKVWRFALEEIEGSVQDAYAQKFKELVEKRTGGKVEVKIYPYGTLGTSDHLTELVENGAIHFAMSSPGHLGKLIPAVQVFLLHYLLPPKDQINKKLLAPSGEIVQLFKKLYREKGFELLDFYSEGWNAWTTNKEVTKPSDFEGLKIRVMTTPLLLSAYEAYGANPTPMAYSEIYSGLQLRMIDGQVNPVFAIEEMSFYEVTDHMIFPGHSQFITSVISNEDFYRNLDPEMKKVVKSTIKDLNGFIFKAQKEYNQKRLAIIKEKNPDLNIIRLDAAQQKAFKNKAQEVRELFTELAPEHGERLLEKIEEIVEEAVEEQ